MARLYVGSKSLHRASVLALQAFDKVEALRGEYGPFNDEGAGTEDRARRYTTWAATAARMHRR